MKCIHLSTVGLLLISGACVSDKDVDTDTADTDTEDTDTEDTDTEDTDTDTDTDMPAGAILLNEIVPKNETLITDEVGDYEDWVELYNSGSQAVDLSGWSITDDYGTAVPWVIPGETTIEANGYLLIWCDEDATDGPLHADFKLSKDGETVTLLNAAGDIVDETTFEAMLDDTSWARIPNGSETWQVSESPTPNEANPSTSP